MKKGFSWIWMILIVAILVILVIVAFLLIPKKGKESAANTSAPAAESQEGKLVALGASMTRANNLSSSQVGDNNDYSFVTGKKIESLISYLNKKGEKLTAINLAESGASSKNVLEKQLPNGLSYHPKYATIDITADIFEDSSPSNLKTNLTEIVSQLKAQGATVLLGSYPNFFAYRSADLAACKEDKLKIGVDKLTPEKLQSFNQAIREVAQAQNVIFVDVYNVLGPSDISDYDCVHANVEGQNKLAKAWIDALEKSR